jgi:hypothetical protein
MNLEPALQPATPLACNHCTNHVSESDTFCQQCGYPVRGTEEQVNEFNYKVGYKQMQLNDSHTGVRKGRNSLYVVAGIFAVYGLVYYFMNEQAENAAALLLTNIMLSVVFLLLGFWSMKKPIAALISGLALFVAIHLLNLIVEPATIFQGIIMKVLVIIYLVRALRSAFEAEKISKDLNGR